MARIKTGGRKKNVPNKRSVEAIELAERMKCNPFKILLQFAKGDWKALGYKTKDVIKFVGDNIYTEDRISAELRQSSAKAACEYVYSKRKAIEHSATDGSKLLAPAIIYIPTSEVEP